LTWWRPWKIFEKSPVGFRKAALKLQDLFLNHRPPKTAEEKPAEPEEKKAEPLANVPLNFTLDKRIKPDHPFLLNQKGLDLKTINKFGLGYCFKGMMAGRIVIRFTILRVRLLPMLAGRSNNMMRRHG